MHISSRAFSKTFRQILRFAGVGILATLVHIATALCVETVLGLPPVIANGAGFVVAFAVSFVGHARFTFRVAHPTPRHMRRFLALSLLSLVLSTLITVAASHIGASFMQAMICVGFIVPVASYLGARFWAFAAVPPQLRTAP